MQLKSFNGVFIVFLALLLPFVASNVPSVISSVHQLQLFDVSRLLLVVVFLLAPSSVFKKFLLFKKLILILFFLSFAEFFAILLNQGHNSNSLLKVFNLPFSLLYYIFLPYVTLDYLFCRICEEKRNIIGRNVLHTSNLIVIFVCILQLNSLFDVISPVSAIYNNFLFYFFEGRWGGWGNFSSTNISSEILYLSNITTSPIVLNIKRLSGTFQEPASLAIYCSLALLPLLFSFIESGKWHPYRFYMFSLFLAPVLIFFTVSSTGFLVLFVDITILIFFLSFKKNKAKLIFLYFLFGAIIIILMPYIYEKLYVFEKLITVGDDSSSTRYGSIFAAVNLFLDNPFGVGYGNHTALLPDYIPDWGLTIENTKSSVALHSLIMRVVVDFGVIGIGVLIYILRAFYITTKRICEPDDSTFARYFFINVIIISISDLPFNEIWLIFIFYLVFNVFIKKGSKSETC
ncbi:O-antigen ligase family protein [Vibrio cyclitrophicus]